MKPAIQRPETLRVDRDARGVVRLTIDRPEIRNAFDDVLIGDLTTMLDELAADDGIRALVLTGAGAAFSAGAEPGWMGASGRHARKSGGEGKRVSVRCELGGARFTKKKK